MSKSKIKARIVKALRAVEKDIDALCAPEAPSCDSPDDYEAGEVQVLLDALDEAIMDAQSFVNDLGTLQESVQELVDLEEELLNEDEAA